MQADVKLKLSQQTIHHPFKITRCQRRLQGKCLPRDTQLSQRGLPQWGTIRVGVRVEAAKVTLVSWSRWADPPLPTAYPHSTTEHRSTLSPYHCVAGQQQQRPWHRADTLPLACHCHRLCQSFGSATAGTLLFIPPWSPKQYLGAGRAAG